MNESVLFTSASALCLGSVPMSQDATDIAHTIMDASDLIEIRAEPGGPRASGSGPRSEKNMKRQTAEIKYRVSTPSMYPMYVILWSKTET